MASYRETIRQSNDHTNTWFLGLPGSPHNVQNVISKHELDTWLNGIHAGYTTYVFNQCFSGGMLMTSNP